MIGGVVALLFFLAVPSVLIWIVIDSLRTGVVRGRGGPLSQTENPIGYWIVLTFYVGVIGAWAFVLGTLAIEVMRGGWG